MSDKSVEIGAAASAAAPSVANRVFHLPFGYPDKADPAKVHQRVEIGRRPQAKDFFFDTGDSRVMYDVLLQSAVIAAFGDLPMPTPQTVLLELNQIDRERLTVETAKYMTDTLGDRTSEVLGPGKVRLAFGLKIENVTYDVVEFGHLLTGHDELKIEAVAKSTWAQRVATFGREIVKLSNSNSGAERQGPFSLEEMETLDWFDLMIVAEAEVNWLDSFRRSGDETD